MAQTTQPDSVKQRPDEKIQIQTESVEGEIVLGTIEIRGKVDKPGVIIMPKRVEPEIGEMELERSFKKELSEGVGEIPKPEKALRRLDTVKSIKKTVERERK
jgi:hypothetical protein